jgi:mannose-6-phosphate isomerase-like protein (cupin superfamily)
MFSFDLEKETLDNKDYRRVIHTTPYQQLVLMKLSKTTGLNVPWEIHEYATQFIRVESGTLEVSDDKETREIHAGESVTIPPGKPHFIKAKNNETVKLYTIYSPPEHKDGLIQRIKV